MARKKKSTEETPAAEQPASNVVPLKKEPKKKKGSKKSAAKETPPAEAAGELTPLEEAAMSADAAASSEAAGLAATSENPPSEQDAAEAGEAPEPGVDESFVERGGQVAMFPSDAKFAAKEVDITEAYKSVQARLKSIGESSKFFRGFTSFMAELDPGPEGNVCQENLKAALVRCEKLRSDLQHALTQLKKIDELEADLAEMGAALAKAGGGKRGTNCPTVKMLPSETEVLGKLGKALQPHVPELQENDDDDDDADAEPTLENFEKAAKRGEGYDPEAAVTHREPITDDNGEVVGETLTIDPTQHGAGEPAPEAELGEEVDPDFEEVDDSSEQFSDEIDDAERRESLVNSHE